MTTKNVQTREKVPCRACRWRNRFKWSKRRKRNHTNATAHNVSRTLFNVDVVMALQLIPGDILLRTHRHNEDNMSTLFSCHNTRRVLAVEKCNPANNYFWVYVADNSDSVLPESNAAYAQCLVYITEILDVVKADHSAATLAALGAYGSWQTDINSGRYVA